MTIKEWGVIEFGIIQGFVLGYKTQWLKSLFVVLIYYYHYYQILMLLLLLL